MNHDLRDQLYKSFPRIFCRAKQLTEGSIKRSQTPFTGLTVGDGWFQLIHDACFGLEAEFQLLSQEEQEAAIRNGDYVIEQVKEKFGALRIYLSSYTGNMAEILHEAEHRSNEICEFCGKSGTPRTRSWIKTRCDNCQKLYELGRDERTY